MNLKKFNLKAKQNNNNKIHGYSLVHLVLCFPTYYSGWITSDKLVQR
jgi:hypothetical protein